MLTALLALMMAASIYLIVHGYGLRKAANAFDPLTAVYDTGEPPPEAEAKPSLRARLLAGAKRFFEGVAEDMGWLPRPINLPQKLAWAGKLGEVSENQFVGEQLLYMTFSGLFGGLIGIYRDSTGLAVVLLIVLAAVGFYLPIYLLNGEGKKRQTEITVSLPDAVDLISTSVSAGLPIDRSITYAARNVKGPLGDELTLFLQQMELGTPRFDAFQNLIWRNNSDEMQIIIGALLQGQSMGVPISETLEAQVDLMRERRLQRAKEAGANAAPRITLATTIFIVPSIFLMFLAIVAYSIYLDAGPLFNAGG